MAKAKEKAEELRLWMFQANVDAISFYKRNGFLKVRETDGSDCQEKCPTRCTDGMRLDEDDTSLLYLKVKLLFRSC